MSSDKQPKKIKIKDDSESKSGKNDEPKNKMKLTRDMSALLSSSPQRLSNQTNNKTSQRSSPSGQPSSRSKNKKREKVSDSEEEEEDQQSALESMLNSNTFDEPIVPKSAPKFPKSSELKIDLENDSQEEIIKKLIVTVKKLQDELNSYKVYADGTFCTSIEFNRNSGSVDNKLTDIENKMADLSNRMDSFDDALNS